jgi:tetratricopeptide (TPR) repeat protein
MIKVPRERIQGFLGDGWILVIEPNGNYRASIKQFLANLKITKVVFAVNPQEAMRALHFGQKRWALLMAEWNLPDTNGLQLLRSIRAEEKFRELPFVLTSVENLKRDVVLAGEVGVDAYLLKPFSYEEFAAQLDVVARSRLPENNINRQIEEAEEALAAGDLDRASSLFQRIVSEKNDSARALHGMARIAEAKGLIDEAVALLSRAIGFNSSYIEAYRALLDIHVARKNHAEVLNVGLALHRFSPDNPTYCLRVAYAYLSLNQLDDSERFFGRTIRLSPRLAVAFKGLGDVFVLRSDYDAAMRHYHKALDLDARDTGILNAIALAYVRIGKVQEGIQKYLAALRIDPEDVRILFNVGYAYERIGEFLQAREYYVKALSVDAAFEKPKNRLKLIEGKSVVEQGTSEKVSSPAFLDDDEFSP